MRRALPLLALLAGCAPAPVASDYVCTDQPVVDRDDGAAVQALLDQAVADGLPGVAIALRKGNGDTFTAAAGFADLDAGAPMMACTPMRVGAISMMLASTAVLVLAEEGRVDLDAAALDLIDDPEVAKIPNIAQISLRQLLNHTSGIPDYLLSSCAVRLFNDPSEPFTADQAVRCMAALPADFSPGTDFKISNSNTVLVQRALESITGLPADQVLANRVSVPLGLSSTVLTPDGVAPLGTTQGYGDLSGEGDIYAVGDFALGTGLLDGGVVSDVSDLALFADTLLRGDFIDRTWLREMKDDPDIDGQPTDYGLGLVVKRQSTYGRAFGHKGLSLGTQGEVWYLPDAHLTLALLVNGSLGVLQERAAQLSEDELAPLLLGGAL